MVTLYIATHNKTGLKYFGKTTRYNTVEDLQKYYHGSGAYWNNHLRVHGDDVTMEIYGIYSVDNVEDIALKFSEDNNIVKVVNEKGKKIWANEKPENGLDGGYISEEVYLKLIADKRRDIDENGLNSIQRGTLKMLKTKSIIDENGLTGFQRQTLKTLEKLRNDVDENGLNGLQRRSAIAVKTQLEKSDENGLNGFQQIRKSQIKKMKEDIDENGLNGLRRSALKGKETMRTTINPETGKNMIEEASDKLRISIMEKTNKKYGPMKLFINGKLEEKILYHSDIMKIDKGLITTSEKKPKGKTPQAASRLRNNDKEYLIGAYIVKLK